MRTIDPKSTNIPVVIEKMDDPILCKVLHAEKLSRFDLNGINFDDTAKSYRAEMLKSYWNKNN